MGGLSWVHVVIFGLIALVLFGGRGKLSDVMGDFAKGIKSFKKGLSEDDDKPKAADPKPVEPKPIEQKPETKE